MSKQYGVYPANLFDYKSLRLQFRSKRIGRFFCVSEDLFPSEKPRLNFSFREMATCAVPRRVIDIPDACWRDIRVSSKEIPRIIFVFDASQSRNVHSVNCNNVFSHGKTTRFQLLRKLFLTYIRYGYILAAWQTIKPTRPSLRRCFISSSRSRHKSGTATGL